MGSFRKVNLADYVKKSEVKSNEPLCLIARRALNGAKPAARNFRVKEIVRIFRVKPDKIPLA